MSGSYNLGTASGRIVVDASAAKIGFGIAEAAANQFFSLVSDRVDAVRNVGATVLASSTAAAGGFLVAGNAAANFEERLSAVQAVSGASADEMKQVSDAALQIGKDTKFSATEAASAFEELVKAGISVNDALDGAAAATANLAAAGEIALPRAAEIAATAMNNFNLAGKDMPRIADLVAGAANASAISVDEFASSLSQVGAVANLAGLSFDDTAVAIAEMGNAGIKGSDAGTSLKTMLMNLIPTMDNQIAKFQEMGLMTFSTEKAMAAMAKNGIKPIGGSLLETRQAVSDYIEATQGIKDDTVEMGKAVDEWLIKNGAMQNQFFTTEGKVKGLADIQQVLNESTKDMTKEQKLASLELLFGADAIRGAAVMADNGAKGFNDLAGAMGKVGAADVAATRMDNLKGSIEQLKGGWETLMIQIGTVVLPVFKSVVDAVSAVVDWLISVNERARNFFVTLGALGTGLGLLVGSIVTVAGLLAPFLIKWLAFKGVVGIFNIIRNEVLLANAAVAAGAGPITILSTLFFRAKMAAQLLVGQVLILQGAVARLGAIIAFAGGPWGALIKIILAVIAAAVVLYNTWEPFRNLIDGLAGIIGGALGAAMQFLNDVVQKLIGGFLGLKPAADPLSQALFNIGQGAQHMWVMLQGLWQLVLDNVVPALQELWKILQSAFGDAFAKISAVVQSDLMPALQRLGETFVNDLFPALQKVGEFLLPIVGFVLQVAGALLGTLFIALVNVAAFILGTVIPAIIEFAGPVLAGLIDAIATVATWVIKYLITPFVDFISFLTGTVIPAIVDFGAGVVDAIGKAVQFVGDVIGNVVDFISTIVKSIQDFFGSMGKAADDGASGVGDAFGAVGKWLADLWTTVTTLIGGIVNNIVAGFTEVYNFLLPMLTLYQQIFDAVWGVIWAIISGVVGLITRLFQFATGIWQMVWEVTANYIRGVWEGFIGWITDITTAFVDWWNTMWGGFANWIVEIWNGFVNWIIQVWQGFMNWLIPMVTAFIAFWNTSWTIVGQTISNIWNGFIGWIQGVWSGFVGWLNTMLSVILAMWNTYWAQVASGVTNIWQGFVGFIQGVWQGFLNWLQGMMSWLDSITGGGASRAADAFINGWNGLINGAKNAWDGFMGWVNSIPGMIRDAFAGASTWLQNAGQQIIDGLLSGLRGAAGAITDFFKGITDSIPQIKGPPSRDRVLLKDNGKLIMNSLRDGLKSGLGEVYDILDDMNTSIPLTLGAVMDPDLAKTLSLQTKSIESNYAPIVNVAGPKVTVAPQLNAKIMLGTKDITDMVDMRVDEHFEDASSLIETGVVD